MEGRLHAFLQAARERVASGYYAVTGASLEPNGGFRDALLAHPTPIIAELKPASPSEGRLLETSPEAVLSAFRNGGAAALSVLTVPEAFGGSLENLRAAHATGLPTLMKDFVTAPQQLAAARANGASAVLLIERCMGSPLHRESLVEEAHRLGLEVLLEIFNEAEWKAAQKSQADMVGVNARDLETLEVDLERALTLVARIAKVRPVVALSGVQDRTSYRATRSAGACAALVGTALMRSPDPALALRALQRPIAKVCGLSTRDDVLHAAKVGADLVGFVVGSPGSPRDIAPEAARQLIAESRGLGMRTVLVTRHADPAQVQAWAETVRPHYVQVHAFVATPAWAAALRPALVLQAVEPGTTPPDLGAAGLVVDPSVGTGKRTDPAATKATIAHQPGTLCLVAGGLSADNAAQTVVATGAWGADASSGLESRPGHKDPGRVARYVQAVHAA